MNSKSLRKLRLTFGVVFFLSSIGSSISFSEEDSAPLPVQIPKGIVAYRTPFEPIPEEILQKPFVKGVALRAVFKKIEPQEGSFEWNKLQREIDRSREAGKWIVLHVMDGSKELPEWLLGKIKTIEVVDNDRYHKFTFGHRIKVPVFWDNRLLQAKRGFHLELGRRFGSDPDIKVVSVSFANWYTDDWYVPDSPDVRRAWRAAGYTPEKLIQAGQEMIDVVMSAFPGKAVLLPVGRVRLDREPLHVVSAVVHYARSRYPGRLIVQNHRLSAKTPWPRDAAGLWGLMAQSRPLVAAQMLWYVTQDGTFRMNGGCRGDELNIFKTALHKGLSYQMRYMEIYLADLLNPVFQGVLVDVAHRMEEAEF